MFIDGSEQAQAFALLAREPDETGRPDLAAEELFPGWEIFKLPTTQRLLAGSSHGAGRLFTCYRHIQRSHLPQVGASRNLRNQSARMPLMARPASMREPI